MNDKLIVSISGIRGIVGTSLFPEEIIKFSSAFAEFINGNKIVVGYDGRITGKIISNLVVSTLLFLGKDVIDLGIVPTPTVQIAIEHFAAAGGIAITASHNPIEWNGLKFLSSTGMFLDTEENKKFMKYYNNVDLKYKTWDNLGKYIQVQDFIDIHIEKILNLKFINIQEIKKKRFRVVIDCVNSSGSIIIPKLLEKFNCEIIKIHCNLTGIFPHSPEPLPENLGDLCKKVIELNADFGIAVDPDADRLVLICENGEPFGEELTITQVIKFILEKKRGIAVINLSTTRAVDDIVKKYNCELIKTPTGEINVAKKMKEIGAVIGGEGSGGVILPDIHYGRDSLAGIGITLQHLTEFSGSLSQLKLSLPKYSIVKNRINLRSDIDPDRILTKIIENHKKEKMISSDGVRIDYENSWIIIRKSNTEPIIRIYSEGKTKDDAKSLADAFIKEIEEIIIN